MGLLDGFEKLINEHGSAAILKERITLAEDKYAALGEKLATSELRAKEAELRAENLESENQGLRLDLQKAQEKTRNLEEQLIERHGQRLEELREKLLQLLAEHPGITSQQLGSSASVNPQLATFHLTDMQDKGLVNASFSFGGDTEWFIAQDGLGYLVRHGLLA